MTVNRRISIAEGSVAPCRTEFRTAANALISPTLVVARVRRPSEADGTGLTIQPITPITTGVYQVTLTPDEPGLWHVELRASGTLVEVHTFAVDVRRTTVRASMPATISPVFTIGDATNGVIGGPGLLGRRVIADG